MLIHIIALFLFSVIAIRSDDTEKPIRSFITNPSQKDGFGSQFQSIISAVVYAELNNKNYVYTPFIAMEHNYDNDLDFLTKKEQFINFIDNFELNKTEYNARAHINYKSFFDTHIKECENSRALKKIKKIFRANKHTESYFNDEHLNIAIHVRRFNTQDSRVHGTDTPDNFFLNIISALRILYVAQNPLFHLYSQGDLKNFIAYTNSDTVFHLNESIEDTFLGMVLADVLVTGTSSFSYTAALLSEGDIYYIPFWHAPLSHWISVHDLMQH